MGTVLVDVSMSLDGFRAGPNVSIEQPMGEGGQSTSQTRGLQSAKADFVAARP